MSETTRTTIYVGYPFTDFAALLMVENILDECGIDSYTIYEADGHWKGASENAIVIEIIGDEPGLDVSIREAAHILKNNMDRPQDAVYLVTEIVDLMIV